MYSEVRHNYEGKAYNNFCLSVCPTSEMVKNNIEKKGRIFFQFFFKQLLFKAATSIASCLLGILKLTLKRQ